jgi:uncharacterized cupredoxin-like copper-binding protein
MSINRHYFFTFIGGLIMRARILKSAVVSVALVAGLASCGSDSNDSSGATSNAITGNMKEWTIKTDATTAKAGEVTFTVTNDGTIEHEFLVVKTDIADGKIPVDGDRFSETSDGVKLIDEIEGMTKGATETLTVTLAAGNYQLVCNVPGHYTAGMHTAFTVVA